MRTGVRSSGSQIAVSRSSGVSSKAASATSTRPSKMSSVTMKVVVVMRAMIAASPEPSNGDRRTLRVRG